MEDIEILENMRDEIYGAMQFEDDYQVSELEEKQFNALNLAIKTLKEREADKERIKELEKENEDMKALFEVQASIAKELDFDTDKKMTRFKDTYYVPDTMEIKADIGEPKRIDLSYIEATKYLDRYLLKESEGDRCK